MYVALSKLFWFFAAPSSLLALLALAGVSFMALTRRRRGFALVAVAAAALGLIRVLPVGDWAILPLESRFPRPPLPERVDGIVLVDGFVATGPSAAWGQAQLTYGGQLTAAAALARRYAQARIVVTAGEPWIIQTGHSETEFARGLLQSLGVSADRLIVDSRARNKYENAVASYAQTRPRAGEVWLLIAPAYAMPRVIGAYRRAGWTDLIAYPVGYETPGFSLQPSFELTTQLLRLDQAVREWLGLIVYWALGRSSELYPGP